MRASPLQRIAAKSVADEHGCLNWTGSLDSSGYARVGYQKRNWKASRVAWTMINGPIPVGLQVLHKCDNRRCVNVDHFFLGTNSENMADMVSKGRSALGRAKLTAEAIKTIREQFATGTSTLALATRHKVTQANVYRIVNRETWKHI